jgi:hypothetical protein
MIFHFNNVGLNTFERVTKLVFILLNKVTSFYREESMNLPYIEFIFYYFITIVYSETITDVTDVHNFVTSVTLP